MINRIVKLPNKRSFFLFGARGTGKTTLLRQYFKNQKTIWIDLLDPEEESQLQIRPKSLSERLVFHTREKKIKWVVIDEIQKAPALLDVIHQEIEKKRFLFALTGSSARKLKRGGANLLAGRAFERRLYPLTHLELDKQFNLDFVLRWGSLPEVFSLNQNDCKDYLRSYANTYVKEEIQAEQIVRKLVPFRLFLEVAAQSAGTVINYSKIARDIGSDPVSVQSYFQIAQDTFIGFLLLPYHRSLRKRQSKNPKFYFFDLGVCRALDRKLDLPIEPRTYEYGNLFEQFVINEIYRINHYKNLDWQLSYMTTIDGGEVDLIIERPGQPLLMIEIKSSTDVTPDKVSYLARLQPEFPEAQTLCISKDSVQKEIKGVTCLHFIDAFQFIGLG